MKAQTLDNYGGANQFTLRDVPIPEAGQGEVRITGIKSVLKNPKSIAPNVSTGIEDRLETVHTKEKIMNLKLAVVILPVSDVDRAKAFYVEQMGFTEDYDMAPNEHFRVVQLTPPGSSTSIAIGVNLWNTPVLPGSTQGLRLIVEDLQQTHDDLSARGVAITAIDDRPWGRFAWFSDPDGNGWELSQMPNQA